MVYASERLSEVHSDIRGPLFYKALELEGAGRRILKLNTGNPASFGFEMPESVYGAICGREREALGYCDFRGMPEARRAICEYERGLGIENIFEDDVFIGNGVSEVVNFALSALLNSGDEVLLPSPCYPLWSNTVRLLGAKPVFYVCDERSEWNPDINDMRRKITAKTRAIVIINPNNPTGAVYSREILIEIAELARKNRLLLFSDEIYDRLVIDGEHTAIASLAPDIPVVTLNGLSKSHCLCGFRVGWMVISGPVSETLEYREGLVKLTSLRLCSNAISQLVIPSALSDIEFPRSLVSQSGRLYLQREACTSSLSKIPDISFVKNRGAFYVFPKIDVKKHNISDDRIFAGDLLSATGILVVPGSGFEWSEPDHFRIVMLPRADVLSSAVLKIGEFLDTYVQKI